MASIKKIYKEQLSYWLAKGHSQFGRVAPRRPYRDEDEEGGAGTAGLTLLEHPFLMDLPVGAASDLTAVASVNSEADDEALDRAEECCPELQQQPKLRNALTHGRHYTPPTPSAP